MIKTITTVNCECTCEKCGFKFYKEYVYKIPFNAIKCPVCNHYSVHLKEVIEDGEH